MLHPDALAAFALAQKRLLVSTYNDAWHQGVANYPASGRPVDEQAEQSKERDEATLTGAALLAARRRRQYVPPTLPEQYRRAIAVAPALNGVNNMVGELSTLAPSQAHLDAAQAAVQDGAIAPADAPSYALTEALANWVAANDWRLNAGESVAWAGEQAGYGEAANAAGDLLEWETEGDDHVCADCEALGEMDAMPLSEWPTTPGAGDTECDVGCRCGFSVAATMPSTDTFQSYPLGADAQAVTDAILQRRSEALNGLMPDAALLS